LQEQQDHPLVVLLLLVQLLLRGIRVA